MIDTVVRPATARDASVIAAIYNHYIRDTIITFEETEVTVAEMADRLGGVAAAGLPWLVAERSNAVAGYAYASAWKVRSAYRFSVETTVYLAPDAVGLGLGTQLYAALFAALGRTGVHVAIGGIALPNAASIALHEKFGMTQVAHLREVGCKFGRWIDVGYWQCRLPMVLPMPGTDGSA